MKKSKIIIFAIVTLGLFLSIGMFTSVLNNYKEQNKNTTLSLQNVISQGKSQFTIKDYQNLTDTYEEMTETAFACELDEKEVYETKITPVLINHNFLPYSNITVEGEGITEVMEDVKERTAVIGKTFAEEHFYGDTAIGKTFKLNDLRYRVTGIYDDKNDRLNNLFKDDKERIYIPYTSVNNYENEKLTTLTCVEGSDIARLFPKLSFENFERIDFTEKNLAINSFTSILSFIITIVIAIYLIALWVRVFSSSISFVKRKMDKQYLSKFLSSNILQIFLRLLVLVGIPIVIILLGFFSLRNFHLVYNYIDKENLFSISHMITTLGETLQRESTLLFGGNHFPLNLYNGTLLILTGLTPVITVLFFFTLCTGLSAVKESKLLHIVLSGIFTIIPLISLIFGISAFFELSALIALVFILSLIKRFYGAVQ